MKKIFFYIISGLVLYSCHPAQRSPAVQYSSYQVQPSGNTSSEVNALIKPYQDSVNKNMNDVIGHNEKLLEKKTGDCTLGYFMTDAFLFMASRKFNTEVHAAFMNYGGIRLTEIPPGRITRGKLFELMPFDNILVLQKVKGSILKQYLESRGETDASCIAGITMHIKNKQATRVMIGNRPLEENEEYVIAHSDFNINNSPLLKPIPVQSINYLQRDALIDYVAILNKEGKKITVDNSRRVFYDQ